MPRIVVDKFLGWYSGEDPTNTGTTNKLPPGACFSFSNVLVRDEGHVAQRFAIQPRAATATGTPTGIFYSTINGGRTIVTTNGTPSTTTDAFATVTNRPYTPGGAVTIANGDHFVDAVDSTFYAATTGTNPKAIARLDLNGQLNYSGGLWSPGIDLSPVAVTGAGNNTTFTTGVGSIALPANSWVIYRFTWHYRISGSAGLREVVGPVSGRYVAQAGGAVSNYRLRVLIPKHLDGTQPLTAGTHYCRIWRSKSVTNANRASVEDECFLVEERQITAAEIAAGAFVYNDVTPDSTLAKSETLYTNSNGGVGVQGTALPPPGGELVEFAQGCLFVGNTYDIPTQQLLMVQVPANGDTMTVDYNGVSVTVRAQVAPALVTDYLTSGAAPSATPEDAVIAATQELCSAINRNHPHVIAEYVGRNPFDNTAGVIIIRGRKYVTGGTLTISVSANGDRFEPILTSPLTVSTELKPNRLRWSYPVVGVPSVPRQIEGFPANNFIDFPDDIVELKSLRGQLFVFTKSSVYRVLGGDDGNFFYALLDNRGLVAGKRLVCRCPDENGEDVLWTMGYGGFHKFTESGAVKVSNQIANRFEALTDTFLSVPALFIPTPHKQKRIITIGLWVTGFNFTYDTKNGTWSDFSAGFSPGILFGCWDERNYKVLFPVASAGNTRCFANANSAFDNDIPGANYLIPCSVFLFPVFPASMRRCRLRRMDCFVDSGHNILVSQFVYVDGTSGETAATSLPPPVGPTGGSGRYISVDTKYDSSIGYGFGALLYLDTAVLYLASVKPVMNIYSIAFEYEEFENHFSRSF